MYVRRVCQRCRTVFGAFRVPTDPDLHPFMLDFMDLPRSSICMRCFGKVYSVAEGHVLPNEYCPTGARLALASAVSALVWFLYQLFSAYAYALPPGGTTDAANSTLSDSFFWHALKIGLGGAAIGLFVPPLIAVLVKAYTRRGGDVSEPHPPLTMPFGQARMVVPVSLLCAAFGIVYAVALVPRFVPESFPLRDWWMRAIVGGIGSMLASMSSQAALFKICRRPLR